MLSDSCLEKYQQNHMNSDALDGLLLASPEKTSKTSPKHIQAAATDYNNPMEVAALLRRSKILSMSQRLNLYSQQNNLSKTRVQKQLLSHKSCINTSKQGTKAPQVNRIVKVNSYEEFKNSYSSSLPKKNCKEKLSSVATLTSEFDPFFNVDYVHSNSHTIDNEPSFVSNSQGISMFDNFRDCNEQASLQRIRDYEDKIMQKTIRKRQKEASFQHVNNITSFLRDGRLKVKRRHSKAPTQFQDGERNQLNSVKNVRDFIMFLVSSSFSIEK